MKLQLDGTLTLGEYSLGHLVMALETVEDGSAQALKAVLPSLDLPINADLAAPTSASVKLELGLYAYLDLCILLLWWPDFRAHTVGSALVAAFKTALAE